MPAGEGTPSAPQCGTNMIRMFGYVLTVGDPFEVEFVAPIFNSFFHQFFGDGVVEEDIF